MKKLPFIFTFILAACSVGVNKDFTTGLSVSNHGFTVEESTLVGPDGTKKSDNKVPMDSKVGVVIQGIGNYELKDGHAFPVLDLVVTDKAGTAVINERDMLASEEGYSPEDASAMRGTVTVGKPMKSGETYHVKMTITDKLKPESTIVAEVDIDVL